VDVTFTIPDPIPITAVSCSPCVVDADWLDPFETIPGSPSGGEALELGAVGLSARPQARAKRETPMAIPNLTWKQVM
jgi:hypothetical protein